MGCRAYLKDRLSPQIVYIFDQGYPSSLASFARRMAGVAFAILLGAGTAYGQRGAATPWTTYEAENMTINGGTVLGPGYLPNRVQSEASGRECVRLSATNQSVEFTAQAAANTMVVRYSVPDTANGMGTNYTLSLYVNDALIEELPVTSMYSWLYGAYPFSNTPSAGSPRNFFDEARVGGLTFNSGDVVKLEKGASDTASYYDIDLVDLENATGPLAQPSNSLAITNYGADPTGAADSTSALQTAISTAFRGGKSVWMPAGTYKITSSITLPSQTTLQGAGMWWTTLVGDPTLYATSSRRVTLNGGGSGIHLADFAIIGKLNYRNDNEPNDGLGGSYGTGSTILRVWVEHTKTGAWIINSKGLIIDSCRFRDTIADGCNIDVGMQGAIVTNCTCRGAGDDCFAMWPATYTSAAYKPGLNLFTHCTGELNFLANGGAIYGAQANALDECLFQDITYGCGILVSSTFSVGVNVFSGTTSVTDCNLNRCGGFDPNFAAWRGAFQICLDQTSISGLFVNNLNISNSVSDGFSVISTAGSGVSLSSALMGNVSIPNYGIGVSGRNGLWAQSPVAGSMTVSNCAVAEHLDASPNFTFIFVTNMPPPPSQDILDTTYNADGSVTLTYATTAGYKYHIEATTNLAATPWALLAGSAITADTNFTTFTDPNLPNSPERFYRIVSP